MNIYQLSQQICDNICNYVEETNSFDGFGEGDIKDSLCQIVVDTINDSTFAPAPKGK